MVAVETKKDEHCVCSHTRKFVFGWESLHRLMEIEFVHDHHPNGDCVPLRLPGGTV